MRFDLHMHSWYSADAADPPEKLIAAARKRGLNGIAITDHDSCEVHHYLREQGLEREDGQAVDGFLIIPGVEVSTAEGHLLCIGTTLPYMRGQPAAHVCREISRRGGVPIPAHPFDHWRSGIRSAILDTLEIEVLEVFNAAVTSRKFNENALAYARGRSLAMTANSDAHHATAVGVSSTDFEMASLDAPALLAALRKGGTPRGEYLSRKEAFKKHFANFFRKSGRPQLKPQ